MKNDLVEDLRTSIYELMKKNKMTCQAFGDALGYPISDVDRILFGEMLLPPAEIERIANLFGMTKSELLHYQEEKLLHYQEENCSVPEITNIINSTTNWILCKDRLPSNTDCHHYDNLTMEHFDCFWVTILQNSQGLTYTTRMCYRPERNLWYRNGSDMSPVDTNKIVAWTHLIVPEPYRFE